MNTQIVPNLSPFTPNSHDALTLQPGESADLSSFPGKPILLVSDDADLAHDLDSAAQESGRILAQVRPADAVVAVRLLLPSAVLVDLDSPAEDSWHAANSLLQEEVCPPLLLLTAHSKQIGVRAAIRSGTAADKRDAPARLLQLLEEAAGATPPETLDRRATQRIIIHWLRASSWPVPVSQGRRFWGINE